MLADLAHVQEQFGGLAEQTCEVFAEIRNELDAEQPDPAEWEWPEPSEPDEDPDPLFDSRRSYVEQIDRYKRHQGKPTSRKRYGNGAGGEP